MSIQVIFDNPKLEYYPGNVISGSVEVEMRDAKKIRRIAIKFKGEVNTSWSERKTRRRNQETEHYTVHYSGHQKLFANGIIFIGGPDKIKLEPGHYSYRFYFTLPHNLPVNWEGPYGSIRYTIKAFVDVPWAFDITCQHEFKIFPIVDLNTVAQARQRMFIEKHKTVGILCCSSGTITMTIIAPTSGFICSDVIPFHVEIENNSTAEIYQTEIMIKKHVLYLASAPNYDTRKESDILAVGRWDTEVKARERRVLEAPLQLRLTEPSSIDESYIIRITYEAMFTCKIRGMHYNLSGTYPVIIGNVPLQGSGNYVQPPTMMDTHTPNSNIASAPTTVEAISVDPADIGWKMVTILK